MRRLLQLSAITFLAACGSADAAPSDSEAVLASAAVDQSLPTVVVYKTETCGCCNGWIEHLRAAGFEVDARNVRDLMTVKLDAGVPGPLVTCHTALIDGYVVEGHVPVDQIKRLLADRPDVAGIGVAGMPTGSPGMEGLNAQPYQVMAFDHAGETSVYAEVDPR
ncbi:MAG: DUF411 domain-containing protein [Gemmatimonadota bacterium]|nr:DUF411 domain-containing protein [Gemmatimonadota bacterium]MDH3422160.1 DUF411 domain-containing protein [Gemmatimonadota bacterium]